VVLLGNLQLESFLAASARFGFAPRISDATKFAAKNRVLLLIHEPSDESCFRQHLQMRNGLWRNLCAERADWNNSPGGDWEQSDWTEDWCAVYKELNPGK
jgi:hypothetical protein